MERYEIGDAVAGVGPAPYAQVQIEHFVKELREEGYARLSAHQYVQAAAHLGRWIETHGIS